MKESRFHWKWMPHPPEAAAHQAGVLCGLIQKGRYLDLVQTLQLISR